MLITVVCLSGPQVVVLVGRKSLVNYDLEEETDPSEDQCEHEFNTVTYYLTFSLQHLLYNLYNTCSSP